MNCMQCGKPLTRDEMGLSRKLISRALTSGYCYACLSERFRTTEEALRDIAESFRKSGCTLFT